MSIYKKCKYFYEIDFYEKFKNSEAEIDVYLSNYDGDDDSIQYLFIGDRKTFFGIVEIDKNTCYVNQFYTNDNYISKFLYFIKKILEIFKDAKKIVICETPTIKINDIKYDLSNHYFFKYNISFFQKHFGCEYKAQNQLKLQKLQLRKEIIIDIFLFYIGVFSCDQLTENEKKKLQFFLDRFNPNIKIFVDKINPMKCHRFYFYLLDRIFHLYKFDPIRKHDILKINYDTYQYISNKLDNISNLL